MQKIPLGKSNLKITPIIMGTWQTGKWMWTGIDDNESVRAIHAAFDNGISTFDTAAVYGDGHSERVLGGALKDRRDKVEILTKVFHNKLNYNQVMNSCEASLKNLQTDYIDLLQIHWPAGSFKSKQIPVEETLRAFNKLKKDGKIRVIGVSNFNLDQLKEARQFAEIVSIQPPYSLFWRQAEFNLLPFVQESGMTLLAYSPLAQGILSGKFKIDHQFDEEDHRHKNHLFHQPHWDRVQTALSKIRTIAEAKQITMAELALAWLISHPNCAAIAGARNAEQSSANSRAAGIKLTDDELKLLDVISRSVYDYLPTDPLQWTFGQKKEN
ncbi:MAG: aldo/keto reductase [Calditrichaeota bacterium]|nr:aldo/keto reductase [Calditrichota bacterium]